MMKGITCCADCAYYNMKKHRCTRATEEGKPTDHFYADCPLPTVIKAQGWVSVKDRLPEVGVDVLTASKTECESYYMVDCIVNGDWWLQAGEEVLPVTHWMPLPAPPREDE